MKPLVAVLELHRCATEKGLTVSRSADSVTSAAFFFKATKRDISFCNTKLLATPIESTQAGGLICPVGKEVSEPPPNSLLIFSKNPRLTFVRQAEGRRCI